MSTPLESPHVLGFGQHVPFERAIQFGAFHARRKSQRMHIERVQAEEIPVRPVAFGRARAAISQLPEIVLAADAGTSGRVSLWQVVHTGRNIVEQPVIPGSPRGIRIVYDQRKAARVRRPSAPFERRGDIRSLTGVQAGYPSAIRKCVREQLECHNSLMVARDRHHCPKARLRRLAPGWRQALLQYAIAKPEGGNRNATAGGESLLKNPLHLLGLRLVDHQPPTSRKGDNSILLRRRRRGSAGSLFTNRPPSSEKPVSPPPQPAVPVPDPLSRARFLGTRCPKSAISEWEETPMKRTLLAAGMALVFVLAGFGQGRGPRGGMGMGTAPGAEQYPPSPRRRRKRESLRPSMKQ